MMINNGQSSRSYSPVASNMRNPVPATEVDHKAKLKELIKEQIAHEIHISLIISDLACSYWKMGLEGHKCKMKCAAIEEYKENFDWRKYYYHIFDEIPHVQVHYESKDFAKSLDDVHNKLYELHTKNKERLHEILNLSHMASVYTDMELLIEMYQKCTEYIEKLESEMKKTQVFGYDIAYILCKDDELKRKYD